MTPLLRRSAIIGGIAYGVLAVVGAVPALLSAFMFDAPGSDENPLTVALAAGLVATPLTFLLSAILLGFGYMTNARAPTIVGLVLPILPVAAVVAATLALQWFCGGRFVCR